MTVDSVDPTKANVPEYVVVFAGNQAGHEHTFSALSDEAAEALARRQYPGAEYALFRVGGGERRPLGSATEPFVPADVLQPVPPPPLPPAPPVAGL